MTISPNARSITREDIEARLLETLQAEDGAGSAMRVSDYNEPWLELDLNHENSIDIHHLASDIIQMIEDAGGEVK